MRIPLERVSVIVALFLIAGLSAGGPSRNGATPPRAGIHLLGASAGLSRLPAGLARAVAQTLGPDAASDPDPFLQQQELVASDGAPGDVFGDLFSVALSKDGMTALIGAAGKNSFTGAAYIFTTDGKTWTELQELTASDGASGDEFGLSVALDNEGKTALIGAIGKNSFKGAAYVFTEGKNTYTQQQELMASDGMSGDEFGLVSLSDDGKTALIGAFGKNSAAGAAYIFTDGKNTFTQQQELVASDGASSDEFGISVALDTKGDIALIGAVGTNSFAGAAYVFTEAKNTYTQQQELVASDGAANDEFGVSVALDTKGDIALIGAAGHNSNTGAAYIFTEKH